MFFKHWPVLIVDDDLDVLTVSRLAMKGFEVYGLPLKIYTAESRKQATDLMNDDVEVGCSLAVAFIDVVMETDRAGLELCEYIRSDLGNRLTQIFIRTGQPGIAPERQVIDAFDINGYFTKVEATEDKLYSLVKSSVRQYLAYGTALATVDLSTAMIAAGRSRRKIRYALSPIGSVGPDYFETPRWLILDDVLLFDDEVEAEEAERCLSAIQLESGTPLDPAGDRYHRTAEGYQLVHVVRTSERSDAKFLFKSRFAPPPPIVSLLHSFVRQLATVWHNAESDG